jgi:hypothetical protein
VVGRRCCAAGLADQQVSPTGFAFVPMLTETAIHFGVGLIVAVWFSVRMDLWRLILPVVFGFSICVFQVAVRGSSFNPKS